MTRLEITVEKLLTAIDRAVENNHPDIAKIWAETIASLSCWPNMTCPHHCTLGGSEPKELLEGLIRADVLVRAAEGIIGAVIAARYEVSPSDFRDIAQRCNVVVREERGRCYFDLSLHGLKVMVFAAPSAPAGSLRWIPVS